MKVIRKKFMRIHVCTGLSLLCKVNPLLMYTYVQQQQTDGF